MGWDKFVRQWEVNCAQDSTIAERTQEGSVSFEVRNDDATIRIRLDKGRLTWTYTTVNRGSANFALVAHNEVWERFFSPDPRPPFHNGMAMLMRVPDFRVNGNMKTFYQYYYVVRSILDVGRTTLNATERRSPLRSPAVEVEPSWLTEVEPITGHYIHIPLNATDLRLYYE